jgi:hypothetical protein
MALLSAFESFRVYSLGFRGRDRSVLGVDIPILRGFLETC